MSFTVFKSSAGSGKTFTLVKEYLRLALGTSKGDYYRSILAITFTNKAAGEMKERVMGTLESFAENNMNSSQQFMLEKLSEELNTAPEVLKERASEVLHSILHNYSDFHITTIDKFVQRIIRSFAFDLKIPMNFEIELDGKGLMADAVDVLLSRAGSDEELTKVLVDFCETRADEESDWNIQNDIRTFAEKLLEEDGVFYIDQLRNLSLTDFTRINKQIREQVSSMEEKISGFGKQARTLITQRGINPASLAGGQNGIWKYFEYLSELRSEKFEPSNTIKKNIEENKWLSSKPGTDKAAIEEIQGELLNYYESARALISNYQLLKILSGRIFAISLLNEIEKVVTEFRSEENRIHISEFNKRISEVVSKEPAPYIYERIGEKFRHYLIDEFQDTSELQWTNLLPLIENALGSGYFNMIVGDGKQAIYRFRGGEVQQFANLPGIKGSENEDLLKQREDALRRNYNEQVLEKNFRSRAEIIKFNNDFFLDISSTLPSAQKKIYEKLEQKFNPENDGGSIEIEFLKAEDKRFREQMTEKVYEAIHKAFEDGFKPADIAIITRFNKEGAAVAEYLNGKKIEVSSSESLLLKSSSAVRFLISLLKYIDSPEESSTKAELITFLHPGHESEFRRLSTIDSATFILHLQSIGFNLDLASLQLKSLYETIEELITSFKLNERDPFVLSFLDQVLQFNLKHNKGIPAFLMWWDEKKDKLSVDGSGVKDAVKIMTIHKAKGLEFPVVICPFMNWTQGAQRDHIWTVSRHNEVDGLPVLLLPSEKKLTETPYADLLQEEIEKSKLDDLNILYVAFTRAVDRLHILTSYPGRSGNLSNHFIEYLQRKGMYQEGEAQYSFGTAVSGKKQVKEENEGFRFESYRKGPWNEVVEISRESLKLMDDDTMEKISHGKLVHKLLSEIKSLDEVPFRLNQLFEEGLITSEAKENLEVKIRSLIRNANLERYFQEADSSRSESEILLPDGTFIRPDRVVINENSVTLIDYKTGKPRESDKEQLRNYANVLTEMGYKNVKKVLVYISEEKLEEVG